MVTKNSTGGACTSLNLVATSMAAALGGKQPDTGGIVEEPITPQVEFDVEAAMLEAERMMLEDQIVIDDQEVDAPEELAETILVSTEQEEEVEWLNELESVDNLKPAEGQKESEETDFHFVGIDIPINFQYIIAKNVKKKVYVGVGLSSQAYINEIHSIDHTEIESNTIFNTTTNSYENTSYYNTYNETLSYSSLNKFDFCELLNVSFGYKYALKKGEIVIEPYIKHPIGSLTNQDLKIGSGGISFRYNIGL